MGKNGQVGICRDAFRRVQTDSGDTNRVSKNKLGSIAW